MAEPGDEKKGFVKRVHMPDIQRLMAEAPDEKAFSINDLMDMNDKPEYKFFIDWDKVKTFEDLKIIMSALWLEVIDIRVQKVPSKFLKDKGEDNG